MKLVQLFYANFTRVLIFCLPSENSLRSWIVSFDLPQKLISFLLII